MRLPNFLIIGAAKSGTTALYEYLLRHPQIFLSEPKEPHFLALEGRTPAFTGPGDDRLINSCAVTSISAYRALFARAGSSVAIGEASVSTLYYPDAAERIRRYMPDARIVCVLRNPVDRAFSAFTYMRSLALEPCSDFQAALADEDRRVAEGWHHIWHYRRMGMFGSQLQHYFNAFDREQIRVYLFDDFRKDPTAILQDCCAHIGVDPTFRFDGQETPHVNYSGEPRSLTLARFLTRDSTVKRVLRRVVPHGMRQTLWHRLAKANLERQHMDGAVRADLVEVFRDDVLRLQQLLRRDLSPWLRLNGSSRLPEVARG